MELPAMLTGQTEAEAFTGQKAQSFTPEHRRREPS